MKIILFILFLLPYFSIVKAQQKAKPLKPFTDTAISVLKIPPPKLKYIGNNNHFDIYSATPDNMHIIMPDSTVRFNMPTGKYEIIQIPVKKPKKR